MPYKGSVIPIGPQNIDRGEIKLNEDEVNKGFSQYVDFVNRVFYETRQPTTDIYIGDNFCSSSSDVLNSVIDVLGRTIDAEQGL